MGGVLGWKVCFWGFLWESDKKSLCGSLVIPGGFGEENERKWKDGGG